MKTSVSVVPFVLLAVAAAGCHRNAEPAAHDTTPRAPAAVQAARPSAPVAQASVEQCAVEAVYFAFDSNELDAQARATLERNKRCLEERGAAQVHVTGMADPRGTEEYNLALGDRRAREVATYLGRLGAPEVQVHSMGEESSTGSDESGWARDRRAELQAR
jgi:peptidoglycan-associated lipoprotein